MSYRSQPYTFNKVLNGLKGNDGKGIKSHAITYQVSTSGVTTPTGTWLTSIPSVNPSQYLWTRITITYTDNISIHAYSVGMMGAKGDTGNTGNGITSITEYYALSSSNTTAPTSWDVKAPMMTLTNKYLWSYEVIAFTNGTSKETTKRVIGTYGETGGTGATGTGILSITTEYYLSTSKTSQADGTWLTTMPSWSYGKYLWIRSKVIYKNPTSTAYTVPYCDSSWEAVKSVETDILAWCYNNDKTYINGSKIYANSITSKQLATDSIKSNNYVANSLGSFLNLADGSFDSKYLKWTKEGVLTATSGTIAGIKINPTSLTSSATSGSIIKGYEITNGGAISTYNKGSGRDYWLYLTANGVLLQSQTTAGSVPLEMNLTDSLLSFKSSSTQIAYAKATMDGLELWGINEVRSKSNFYSTNVFADNVPTAGTLGQNIALSFGQLSGYPCFIGSVYQTDDATWFNTISVRHRNGLNDGNQYGMFIRSVMQTTTSSLVWNQQHAGTWGADRTILDSANVGSYAYPTNAIGLGNGHNLNTVIGIGQYLVNEGSNYVNGSSNYLNGVMFIPVSINGAIVLQIYVHYDGATYRRIYWHGSWTAWKRMDNI